MSIAKVALRKESVDRNIHNYGNGFPKQVALRKESVDRNSQFGVVFRVNGKVALRKESVDRNAIIHQ